MVLSFMQDSQVSFWVRKYLLKEAYRTAKTGILDRGYGSRRVT